MTGKYLITTDNYFFAPDGKQYRAVWGECRTVSAEQALGFNPNRISANWFIRVGSEESHVIVAGCQIHYAIKLDSCPNLEEVQERMGTEYEMKTIDCRIFVPVAEDRPEPVKMEEASEHVWHEYDTYKSLRGCKIIGQQVLGMHAVHTVDFDNRLIEWAEKQGEVYGEQSLKFLKFVKNHRFKIIRMTAFRSKEYLSIVIFIRGEDDPIYFCLKNLKKRIFKDLQWPG